MATTVTLSEIRDDLDEVVGRWRSQTATEKRNVLAYLDDLLGELDDLEPDGTAEVEVIDELRCRIETLIDDIETSLSTEPAPTTS